MPPDGGSDRTEGNNLPVRIRGFIGLLSRIRTVPHTLDRAVLDWYPHAVTTTVASDRCGPPAAIGPLEFQVDRPTRANS